MTREHSNPSSIHSTVLEKVRELGPTLRARAVEADRACRLSSETIADLDAAGVFNIGSPAEFGGYELPIAKQFDIIFELAKWDGSCGWCTWVAASTNWIPAGSGRRVVEE